MKTKDKKNNFNILTNGDRWLCRWGPWVTIVDKKRDDERWGSLYVYVNADAIT